MGTISLHTPKLEIMNFTIKDTKNGLEFAFTVRFHCF